jgi:subtilisin
MSNEVEVVDVKDEVLSQSLSQFGIPPLWRYATGKNVKVAIFDSGIDAEHEDLEGAVKEAVNFTHSPPADVYGHGTHCAGVVGARRNDRGISGVAPDCELYDVKVVDDVGNSMYDWLVQGFQWAIANKMDVVSCSVAGARYDDRLHGVVEACYGAGVIVVCAVGNFGHEHGEDRTGYPARFPETIGVGALEDAEDTVDKDKRAGFSATGEGVNIMAPGSNILSCLPGSRYGMTRGTSTACPFVAGLVALVVEKLRIEGMDPWPRLVQELIYQNARDMGVPGKDKFTGFGAIKPEAFFASILRRSRRFFPPAGGLP